MLGPSEYEKQEKRREKAQKIKTTFLTNLDPIWYFASGIFALGFALKLFSDANGDNPSIIAGWAVLLIAFTSLFLGGFLYMNRGTEKTDNEEHGVHVVKHKLIPAVILLISSLAFIGGEINTASNIGNGAGIFSQKAGNDLQLKSLVEGSNVTITESPTEITIALSSAASAGTLSTIEESTVQVGDADIAKVNFGSGFDVTEPVNTEITVDLDITEATLSDDAVFVGSVSNLATVTAITDCDDTGGNHLNYDTTTNTFSCGTSGDGSGASIAVEEGDSSVEANATTLDFGPGFDVTASPVGEANIVLDYTENPIDLATSEVTNTLGVSNGGTGQTTVTDDGLLVSNGSIFSLAILTDCDDSGGNHLNYDTTTNAFSCGTSGSGGTDTHANAEEDNSVVVSDPTAFDFGDGLDVSDDSGEANVVVDITEFNITEDNILVGDGTTSHLQALVNCTGSNYLGYNTTTDAFSCTSDTDTDTDTHANAKEDNSIVVSDPTAFDFGDGFDVSDDSGEANVSIDLLEFNITEDGLLVGAGTTTTIAVLPSCSNGTNDKLLYNSTTNAFACGTDQSASGGGPNVKESGSTVTTGATDIDFGSGFDITDSPTGEANIVLDYTEDPVELSGSEINGTLGAGNGGTGQTSVTDDGLLVANGSVFAIKVLGDCDDSGGNHLNYDTTTNTFSCGTSSSVTDTDTDTHANAKEDNSVVLADPSAYDFGDGFDVSIDSTEVNVALDLTEFNITEDGLLVGSGTTSAIVVLGDCDDSGGNHLNYDTTTNSFSCGTSSSITDTDTHINVEEDNSSVVSDISALDFGDGFDVSDDAGEADVTVDPLEFNITEDGLLVGAGTTSTIAILPSCSNATTSKLLYNSTTNSFTCGTDQSAAGGGPNVKESNSTVTTGATDIDFGPGFDVTDSPAGEANITLDYTEDPVELGGSEINGTLTVGNGGTGITSATDDNIMVGGGSAFALSALTDCDDSDGNHLNYDTATNSFSCGTSTPSVTKRISYTLLDPADADSILLRQLLNGITITDIDCIIDPADTGESVVIDIQETNSTGDSGVSFDTTITCDNDGASDDGSLTNPGFDASDFILLDIGTVTGTVSYVQINITFTE